MRNSIPLLSRPTTLRAPSPAMATPPQPIPIIRLTEPTPGTSPAPSIPPWIPMPSPVAPLPTVPDADIPRVRLVPKKSKLGLLGVGAKEKAKQQQHGKTGSSGRGGFDIYVDPTYDPDIGEIVMVKKKKSRAALDGMQWGPLGEVTNVPSVPAPKPSFLRPKSEEKEKEKEKWWTIGRGRKDSKEKAKEAEKQKDKARSKSPASSRGRFDSLDSKSLLASAFGRQQDEPSPVTYSRSGTPTVGGLLAVPGAPSAQNTSGATDSIAVRAIRSVRSLARLGSWAPSNKSTDDVTKKDNTGDEGKKGTIKGGSKEKESKEKKKKQKDADKKKTQKPRISTSSFEAGALSTASPMSKTKTVGKKQSILGLGLPASVRLPTLRSGSTASSNCLSVDSVVANDNPYKDSRARSGSTLSSGSSLRPLSSISGTSRASSGCSVRWDEECLETVKERTKLDKELRKAEKALPEDGVSKSVPESQQPCTSRKETKRTSDGRRRTLLSEVFPKARAFPIVTVEEATSDGHEAPDDEPVVSERSCQTPPRRPRVRPLSDQLLGRRARPVGIYEDGDGVMSILDAATNDLAQLINRLDLEATPGTPDVSPLRPSQDLTPKIDPESPLKGGLRESMASLSSLRPYGQARMQPLQPAAQPKYGLDLIGQQIAPWTTLNRSISPANEPPSKYNVPASKTSMSTPLGQPHKLRMTHKRTLTPSPAADPSPVLQPLCPARGRQAVVPNSAASSSPTPTLRRAGRPIRAPSSLTFGSRSSSRSRGSVDLAGSPMPSPVFKKADGHSHARKRSSLASELRASTGLPIPPESKRVLGLGGTMGDSATDAYHDPAINMEEPDSDIPDELQVILAGQSDDESQYLDDTVELCQVVKRLAPPSPGCPPSEPLPTPVPASAPVIPPIPVFRAQLIDEGEIVGEVDEGNHSSEEDDTKKSFDFTGELMKLNESGGSDRRSFVEQLENAFRTPAKIDLRYGFSDAFLTVEVPPVPRIPAEEPNPVDEEDDAAEEESGETSDSCMRAEGLSMSRIIDIQEPTLLAGSDSLGTDEDHGITSFLDQHPSLELSKSTSSVESKCSNGQLNTEFKFGGRPQEQKKPLTLSDIIPPLSHQIMIAKTSMTEDDSALLKSIYAKAIDLAPAAPRMRLDSDSSSKRHARDSVKPPPPQPAHNRHSSELSFAGFSSFEEVRRGFEYAQRQALYPPPNISSRLAHRRHESVFSIASVSSYGFVINPGSTDPFDYGMPARRERPISEISTLSMSMSVDDTFAYVTHVPRLRKRVDSDASSFYFRAPAHPQAVQPYNRSHRRQDSTMSITSQGPPISLYNRSMGHRRNDSSASGSSIAHSYALYGANGGRAAWFRHRQDTSIDSTRSEFSAMHLGRPGLGDKMFDKCDQTMPLSAISASPPESLSNEGIRERLSFDSILDNDRRSSMDDSIFDKTGNRSSMSSDSVFGDDEANVPSFSDQLMLPRQFRPLSMVSLASLHSPTKEDDTMISFLAGDGHVRRRSVGAVFDASPCVRFEKKRKQPSAQDEVMVPIFENVHTKGKDDPNTARIISMPSIMSTSSSKFGGERMIKAQRGILARESLEDNCLSGSGEDNSSGPETISFSRPHPVSRSRSSTCTSLSSGADTPPLSGSEGSQSESPQSSIDLSHLNMILANVTHPVTSSARTRARTRAKGAGHRRISHPRASVYETIEEENSNPPTPNRVVAAKRSKAELDVPIPDLANDEVYIFDAETGSISSTWDDERGIVAMRKYYALRDEAEVAVTESKQVWQDTPFSLFAVQSFYPPTHPAGMQALLAHSLETYHSLPAELRRIRSRTLSRPSPYPQPRSTKSTLSPGHMRPSMNEANRSTFNPLALQEVTMNSNIVSPAPTPKASKGPKDIEPKRENAFGLAPNARPRVGSTARRTALGWTKRSNGPGKTSTDKKENTAQGVLTTPGDNLRINRPRPRGRPTPASQRPIRV